VVSQSYSQIWHVFIEHGVGLHFVTVAEGVKPCCIIVAARLLDTRPLLQSRETVPIWLPSMFSDPDKVWR